jgi:hypothetical protein
MITPRQIGAHLISISILLLSHTSGRAADLPDWLDQVQLGAFSDTYFSWSFNNPKWGESDGFSTHQLDNGFSLAWVGLDLAYPADPVGGTLNLRLGKMATLHGGRDTEISLHYLRQAYVSWQPLDWLTLDLGKFYTLYGYEAAESQLNFNYTRGLVYYYAQPIFHTGLRATFEIRDYLAAKVIAVNGWDSTLDNNAGKSFGFQLSLLGSERFALHLGYLTGPEQDDVISVTCDEGSRYDPTSASCVGSAGAPGETVELEVDGANGRFRHLIDLVMELSLGKLTLAFNVDLVFETVPVPGQAGGETDVSWYGAMLGARYRFLEWLAAAARVEYLGDHDGRATGTYDLSLFSATLTGEARITDHVIVRLDNRLDAGNKEVFREGVDAMSKTQFTTTLGVVFTTN